MRTDEHCYLRNFNYDHSNPSDSTILYPASLIFSNSTIFAPAFKPAGFDSRVDVHRTSNQPRLVYDLNNKDSETTHPTKTEYVYRCHRIVNMGNRESGHPMRIRTGWSNPNRKWSLQDLTVRCIPYRNLLASLIRAPVPVVVVAQAISTISVTVGQHLALLIPL
nr:hypothetical protein HmN_000999400 [Hymenolepis microstoma]